MVVEFAGHPKAYGTIDGNTGALQFPVNTSCDPKAGGETYPFTYNPTAKTIDVKGETWTKVKPRVMTKKDIENFGPDEEKAFDHRW